jgi:hypothetical protein
VGEQDAGAEQVELHPAVHLPLERLDPVDVPSTAPELCGSDQAGRICLSWFDFLWSEDLIYSLVEIAMVDIHISIWVLLS